MLKVSHLTGFNVLDAITGGGVAASQPADPNHVYSFAGSGNTVWDRDDIAGASLKMAGNPVLSTGVANGLQIQFQSTNAYLWQDDENGYTQAMQNGDYSACGWSTMTQNGLSVGIPQFEVFRVTDGVDIQNGVRLIFERAVGEMMWSPRVIAGGVDTLYDNIKLTGVSPFFWSLSVDQNVGVTVRVNEQTITHGHAPNQAVCDRFFIGAGNTSYTTFAYTFDELYIWHSALTDDESLWLYNGGNGRFWDANISTWKGLTYDTWLPATTGLTSAAALDAKILSYYSLNSSLTDDQAVTNLSYTNTPLYDTSVKKLGTAGIRGTQDGVTGWQCYRDCTGDTIKGWAGWMRFDPSAATNTLNGCSAMRLGYVGDRAEAYLQSNSVSGETTMTLRFIGSPEGFSHSLTAATDTWYFVGFSLLSDGRYRLRFNDQELVTSTTGHQHANDRMDIIASLSPDNLLYVDAVAVSEQELTTSDFNSLYNAGLGREHPFT